MRSEGDRHGVRGESDKYGVRCEDEGRVDRKNSSLSTYMYFPRLKVYHKFLAQVHIMYRCIIHTNEHDSTQV